MAFVLVLLSAGCNPTRRLSDSEALLVRQNLRIQSDRDAGLSLSEDQLEAAFRQRPNRRVLLLRFHLGVYNLVNPEKQAKAHVRNRARAQRKIERKQAKGKDLSAKKLREMSADTLGWRDWLTNTVGEPPVVFDSSKADRTVVQIKTILAKSGYFNADASYDVRYTSRGRKVKPLTFHVRPGEPYHIRSIEYIIPDATIASREPFLRSTSLVKEGDRFDVREMDKERERIAGYLNNRGYQEFSKDFITFQVDSAVGNQQVDVFLRIRQPQVSVPGTDSVTFVNHKKYFIGKVFIHTNYEPSDRSYEPTDTLNTEGMGDLYILARGDLSVKPELLLFLSEIQPGDLYQQDKIDQTYRRIAQLPMVRSVSIQFKPSEGNEELSLDCEVFIAQMKKQFVSSEAGVTHRDGLFGLSGSLNLSHRNLFSGAELGRLRITGGVEAQQPLTLTENEEITRLDITDNIRFNTFEIGPELTLNFNRFFPLRMDRFRRSNAPRTTISAAFNYQDRPDYIRQLYQFRYSMNFIENEARGSRIFWDIWELSTIKIQNSDAFDALLESLDDDFLSISYRDHLISSGRIGWLLNTQKPQVQKRYFFNRVTFEAAGNLPRLAFEIAGQVRDEEGSHTIGGIRFAQYFKIENDFRYYRRIDERNATAFRIHAGAGIPGANLSVLPFEKSFYAGGANGIRGWRPRTLGPGSSRDSTALVTFNNIGEAIIEISAEYRFEFTTMVEGALFMDVGNIWLLSEDSGRPGSDFALDRFAGELAWSTGLGLRFDFDFFLVRFDLGIQLKDPAKIPGERWAWQPKDDYREFVRSIQGAANNGFFPAMNFNLGIGYPF